MVEYEVTLEEEKRFVKQFLFCKNKIIFVSLAVLLLLGCVILVLDSTLPVPADLLLWGIFMIFGSIVLSFTWLLTCVSTVKNYVKGAEMFCEDGRRKCSVELVEDKFVITNHTKTNVSTLGKEDIVSAAVYKDVLIVKLKSRQSLLMPNIPAFCELFKDYFKKK